MFNIWGAEYASSLAPLTLRRHARLRSARAALMDPDELRLARSMLGQLREAGAPEDFTHHSPLATDAAPAAVPAASHAPSFTSTTNPLSPRQLVSGSIADLSAFRPGEVDDALAAFAWSQRRAELSEASQASPDGCEHGAGSAPQVNDDAGDVAAGGASAQQRAEQAAAAVPALHEVQEALETQLEARKTQLEARRRSASAPAPPAPRAPRPSTSAAADEGEEALREHVYAIAYGLAQTFGFQGAQQHFDACAAGGDTWQAVPSSVDCQTDHVAALLGERVARLRSDHESSDAGALLASAVGELHFKVFAAYRTWRDKMRPAVPQLASVEHEPLVELVLWFLLWGEAANVRHCPELLWLIFHCALAHLRTPGAAQFGTNGEEAYLDDIIRPLYAMLAHESDALKKGDKAIHEAVTYDDVNECCSRPETVQALLAGAGAGSLSLYEALRELLRNNAKPRQLLRFFGKTYLERRSWVHAMSNTFRVHLFLLVVLYTLVIVSLADGFRWSYVSTVAILHAALCATNDVAKVAFVPLGTPTPHAPGVGGMHGEGASRVVQGAYSVAVLVLMLVVFVWENTSKRDLVPFPPWRDAALPEGSDSAAGIQPGEAGGLFQCVAAVYMMVAILSGVLRTRPGFCLPALRLTSRFPFVGFPSEAAAGPRSLMRVHVADYMSYVTFWAVTLTLKFCFNYFFVISELAEPTRALWRRNWLSSADFGDAHAFDGDIVLIFLRWLPPALMMLADVSIFYTLTAALWSAARAYKMRLGLFKQWGDLLRSFSRLVPAFNERVLAPGTAMSPDAPDDLRQQSLLRTPSPFAHGAGALEVTHSDGGEDSSPHEELRADCFAREGTSEAWTRYAIAWNAIVTELRQDDLLSNEEVLDMQFTILRAADLPHEGFFGAPHYLMLPPMLVAPAFCVDAVKHGASGYPNKLAAETQMRDMMVWLACTLGVCDFASRGTALDVIEAVASQMAAANSRRSVSLTLALRERVVGLLQRLLRLAAPPETSGLMSVKEANALATVRRVARRWRRPSGLEKLPDVQLQGIFLTLSDILTTALSASKELARVESKLSRHSANDGATKPTDVLAAVFHPKGVFAVGGAELLRRLRMPGSLLALRTMVRALTTPNIGGEPENAEAARQLLFFANSLFNPQLRAPPPVSMMRSFSALTPHYAEDVTYSMPQLFKLTEDNVTTLDYLRTLYPDEWANFLERMQAGGGSASSPGQELGGCECQDMLPCENKFHVAMRRWASCRSQQLARTVHGVMRNQKAIEILARLEGRSTEEAKRIAARRFQYVVACQIYGKLRQSPKPDDQWKAACIDALRQEYPACMNVAYVDAEGPLKGPFSVLLAVDPKTGGDKVMYKVKLPGNPILGEGKPENQNHSVIFCRGECVMALDMNQDFYLGEALKLRNLGAVFGGRVAICGFREHIFSMSSGALASFAAASEFIFGTLGQRFMTFPLRTRFHYGHPDAFDKLWAITRGGLSKAVKSLHISEDIFGGFNVVMRGGSITYREFIHCGKGRDMGFDAINGFEQKISGGNGLQCMSRDVHRLAQRMDFLRLLSFYSTSVGQWIGYCLVVWSAYSFIFAQTVLALTSPDECLRLTPSMARCELPFVFDNASHGDCLEPVDQSNYWDNNLWCSLVPSLDPANRTLATKGELWDACVQSPPRLTLEGGECAKFPLLFNGTEHWGCVDVRAADADPLPDGAFPFGGCRAVPSLDMPEELGWNATLCEGAGADPAACLVPCAPYRCEAHTHFTEFETDPAEAYSASWVFQLGFITIVPYFVEMSVEFGPWAAITTFFRQFVQGSMFFFIFALRTKAYFFDRTLVIGGAKYVATGRGFTLEAANFVAIYSQWARSHIYFGVEILVLLILFGLAPGSGRSGGNDYGMTTWAVWTFAVTFLLVPFWFNPSQFSVQRVIDSSRELHRWMANAKDKGDSRGHSRWHAWHAASLAPIREGGLVRKLLLLLKSSPRVVLALAVITPMRSSTAPPWAIVLGATAFILFSLAAFFVLRSARVRILGHRTLYWLLLAVVAGAGLGVLLAALVARDADAGRNIPLCMIGAACFASVVCQLIAYFSPALDKSWASLGGRILFTDYSDFLYGCMDYALATCLLAILLVLSGLQLARLQTFLLFNKAFQERLRKEQKRKRVLGSMM